MKRVAVVTGANGFVGTHLVESLLAKGYFVYAVTTDDHAFKQVDSSKLKNLVLFFDDYPKLVSEIKEGVDVFFHCAWQGVWGDAFKDYNLQMRNAVYAGKTMEIAAQLNAKRFVLLSTVNVLEAKKIIADSTSFNKLRATTNYAMAKLSAEMICRTLSCQNGVEFNCAYISMIFGEGNRSMMVPNVVITKLLKGEAVDLIEGKGLYDLVYVKDAVEGLIAIGERGVNLKSYYVGNRELVTFREIFERVGKIVNPDVPLRFGTYPDANYIDYSLIDLDELFNDTGFSVSFPFDLSIKRVAQWIKKNLLQ